MTSRERFIAALERRPPVGRVPHFELVFFLYELMLDIWRREGNYD